MRYRIVEPTCGSAAFTLHLIGAKKPVVPYPGNKWRYRRKLEDIILERGFDDLQAVTLCDIGPWGRTLDVLRSPLLLDECIRRLRVMSARDPREVYDSLHKNPTPHSLPSFAAEHLFLQRLAHKGKAVGTKDGEWRSPGFNTSSANGKAATESFGAIRPLVPFLIENLEEMRGLHWPEAQMTRVLHADIAAVTLEESLDGLAEIWYFDPPYENSTAYPDGTLTRQEVCFYAEMAHQRGALVIISESEPIQELVRKGWKAVLIRGKTNDKKPFQTKKEEWLTISP